MSTRSIHQLMAALSYGDAVSNDALAIQGHLRAAGFDSDIFASFRENLGDVFGGFDLVWAVLAVVTAWRLTGSSGFMPQGTLGG